MYNLSKILYVLGSSSDSDSSLDEEEYFNHTNVAEVENDSSGTRLFNIVVMNDILLYKIVQYNNFMYDRSPGYYDLGDPTFECQYCGANMWYQERMNKSKHAANPKFTMCCGNGKVQLPLSKTPPKLLQELLFNNDSSDSKKFQQHIRMYNMMFAFTSPGAKVDNRFNNGRGPPNIRIQGQSCHRIGSLLPMPGENPRFAQLYIYDTENEIQNRIHGFRYPLCIEI